MLYMYIRNSQNNCLINLNIRHNLDFSLTCRLKRLYISDKYAGTNEAQFILKTQHTAYRLS